MKKKIFLILVLAFLLVPKTSFATLDQRCWVKDECNKFRADFGSEESVGGFYSAAEHEDARIACQTGSDGLDFVKRPIGFCLPAGQSVTSISFGGRTKFSNIGDFIKFIYQYAFIVGSVVAVMVIIVAGVMYIFSGGNSDTVSQAKKKISGAVIGLVLMALSFTILKTINPYLVELRLPSIWAINTAGIAPVKCESLDKGTNLALAKLANSPSTIPIGQEPFVKYDPDTTPTICGNDYYVDKTNGQTCGGSSCPGDGQVCYQKLSNTNRSCNTGNIAGVIYSSSILTNFIQGNSLTSLGSTIFGEGWEYKWVTDDGRNDQDVEAICKNGTTISLNADSQDISQPPYIDETTLRQEYFITLSQNNLNQTYCSSDGGLRGFALYLSLNEEGDPDNEEHYLGINKKTGEVVDIGRHGDTETNNQIFTKNIIEQYLFTLDELKKGINMDIDTDKVCDIDNNTDKVKCYGYLGLTNITGDQGKSTKKK